MDPLSTSQSLSDDAPRQTRILIVEDSKTDASLIREAIERCSINADIHVIRDGHAATQYFDAADASESVPCPDLVLLDLNLPRTSGDEVLKHLRASDRCRYAKVVIVSSSDEPTDRKAVEYLAIAHYFKKPSTFTEFMKLGTIVESVLRG
jgi:CheY-like chemotaxis protein